MLTFIALFRTGMDHVTEVLDNESGKTDMSSQQAGITLLHNCSTAVLKIAWEIQSPEIAGLWRKNEE
jgi:hypothetical protein